MSQGDARLVLNLRERLISGDVATLQSLAAYEKAGLLRSWYDDLPGDWYVSGGYQAPITSSSPSLQGDVYGGLMIQPDNAAYYLVTPGALGVLESSGLGTYDSPYRVIVDPGIAAPAVLPFTSNAGGLSPRWDLVECQPSDQRLLAESRYIYNPATGIASPQLVDKIRAGRLAYRVRTGSVGGGFPGVAAGWLPLAAVCVPAGSSSLLTSDVYDLRPLVRDRVAPAIGSAPVVACEYRFRTAAVATYNQWVGVSQVVADGLLVGGRLERSTPSTLSQFGSSAASGGASGVFNADLAENLSTVSLAGAGSRLNLAAVFPAGLPRWQRYSQAPVGTGRIPNGSRGILLATTISPDAAGHIFSVPLPASMAFAGGATADGVVVASTTVSVDGTTLLNGMGSGSEHYAGSAAAQVNHSSISGANLRFDIAPDALFPYPARRAQLLFICSVNNTGGATLAVAQVTVETTAGEQLALAAFRRVPVVVSNPATVAFECWVPVIARATPSTGNYPATMRVVVNLSGDGAPLTGVLSGVVSCLAWSSSDR